VRKVLRGSLAVLRAEAADEVMLRHPGAFGDDGDIEVVGVTAIHEVTSATQMRKQIRRRGHARQALYRSPAAPPPLPLDRACDCIKW
jgi:hypothetical protein